MNNSSAKSIIEAMLEKIDVKINGNNPSDIQIHNRDTYQRVMAKGALGLGEAYMDGWWDCHRLDIFFEKIFNGSLENSVHVPFAAKIRILLSNIINFQSKNRAKEVARKHYDIGNVLFKNMLDKRMIYSCGYYKTAKTLDEAQEAKLELICKKLDLAPGMRLLDIGCGWGGLAKYAAEKYQVSVVGITISKEQYEHAREYCKDLPIEIRLQDYRDIREQYDRIVSVGMFEHVGYLNYRTFMRIAHDALVSNGLFLLHTIGAGYSTGSANEWMIKYIFPNGVLPTIEQIGAAHESLFAMEDWQNFGAYYDPTLMAWHQNFNEHWDELKKVYDERFYRMWSYYLLSCAGSFRSRTNQLWQIVFSKGGLPGGYMAPR